MNIPLLDLKRQYLSIKPEIDQAIANVIDETAFILGKYCQSFEKNFADHCDAKHCVGVNSGTDALLFAYIAAGIKADDEVITVANTFFATTEPITLLGAKPVFVDIDPETYLIDVNKIESAITKKTKAIVPVHLYGQMADMTSIMTIAKKYNLKVVEDCAQAHDAEHQGKKAGTFGDIAAFSFYPGKNLGAYGDAGCVITNNDDFANLIRKLRDHGRESKYQHSFAAYSSRLDGLQGAILNVKLQHLGGWTEKRRSIAERYNKLLPDSLKKPVEKMGNRHVYHLYTVEMNERDQIREKLQQSGIASGVHYPIPLHLQPAYAELGLSQGSLPVTERVANRTLSLPLFAEMSDDEISYVAKNLKSLVE
ncbi:MAG: DegT/DnrJ/EryC1/StrS family aminotransferase [Patescibacteria group bacterium]|jgi:dTDP-4-amino-4,6-dideoxygalactose transaminase